MSKLDALLPVPRPKDSQNASGTAHEEGLEQIDDALRNRGTLNAEGINWTAIEKQCLAVLADGAHLGALRCLVCCIFVKNDGASPVPLIALLSRMIEGYWADVEPTGSKRERLRLAWLKHALRGLTDILERHLADFPESAPALRDVVAAVAPSVKEIGVEWEGIVPFISRAERVLSQAALAAPRETPPQSPAGSGQSPASVVSHVLTPRERAELRRDTISLAHRITVQDPLATVGYVMRRHATWAQVRALPSTDDNGCIEQYPMPTSIKGEFEVMLTHPTLEGLRKLEDRLVASPLWFGGQHLAARIAEALEMDNVSAVIRSCVAEYLEALPGLYGLKYKNGDLLLSRDVQAWLESEETTLPSAPDLAKTEPSAPGLEDTLTRIKPAAGAKLDRRAKAVLKRDLAQSLIKHGHTQPAVVLLEELKEVLADPILQSWDRSFSEQIAKILKDTPQGPSG